jgi:hypothetical protein
MESNGREIVNAGAKIGSNSTIFDGIFFDGGNMERV